MTALLDLENKLRTSSSAIGRLEAAFAQNPSRGVYANILSLRKLQANLQSEFTMAADAVGADVCRYRLLSDRPSVKAFASALNLFQAAFSQVFDCIHEKKIRDRKIISESSEDLTKLELAYAFSGSFGIALTLPNSKMLFPDMPTDLDKAAYAVFGVITTGASHDTVSKMVAQLGRAPLSAIYEWSKSSAENDAGAGIHWVRGDKTKAELIIQTQQFAEVSANLEARSETVTDEVVIDGVLVGADTKSHRFHFITGDTDDSIRGNFSEAISEHQQAKLPSKYRARLQKNTEISYATNAENVKWFLQGLEEVKS
jgi:hypothetical protein